MAGLLASGDQQRKIRNRNIFLVAFALLIILWTVKLSSYPQQTLLGAFTSDAPKSSPTPPSQISSATLPKTTAQPLPGGLTFSANTSTKAAVIVETRYRQNLIPLMLHFMSVLGPTWPILFYTNEEQMPRFAASAALGRYIKSGHVEIRLLPKTVHFSNSNSVNRFMTDKWLWEDIPAENILMFQSDSILCANAVKSVEDFFDYDFVGAPIAKNRGVGYNGGLSLRKKSTTLRILNKWNWEQTQKEGDRFEDQWYFNRLNELQAEEKAAGIDPFDKGAINLPSQDIAKTFAVETIDYATPLGLHQVGRWITDPAQVARMDEWCPEHKMCAKDYLVDTPDPVR